MFCEIFRLRLEHLNLDKWELEIPAEIVKGQRDDSTESVKIYPKLKEVLIKYLDEYFGDDMKPDYFLFYHQHKNTAGTYSILQDFLSPLSRKF